MQKSENGNNKTLKTSVTIQYSYSNESLNFNDLNLKAVNSNNTASLSLNDIFNELQTRGHIFTNTAVSYCDDELKSNIFCGIIPFAGNVIIPYSNNIVLRLRQIIKKDNLMRMDLKEENVEQNEESNENVFINVKSKRSKERKIGYIIEKVFLWRKLYNGYEDDDGNLIKLTLEEAAEKVGISKKSLDDYLIQLRIGKQHGFNFGEHKNDKVGVLRAFVKKHKYEESKDAQSYNQGGNYTFHGQSYHDYK